MNKVIAFLEEETENYISDLDTSAQTEDKTLAETIEESASAYWLGVYKSTEPSDGFYYLVDASDSESQSLSGHPVKGPRPLPPNA